MRLSVSPIFLSCALATSISWTTRDITVCEIHMRRFSTHVTTRSGSDTPMRRHTVRSGWPRGKGVPGEDGDWPTCSPAPDCCCDDEDGVAGSGVASWYAMLLRMGEYSLMREALRLEVGPMGVAGTELPRQKGEPK